MVKAQVVLLSFLLALIPGCGAGNSVKNSGSNQPETQPEVKEAKQAKAADPGNSTRSISLDELLGNSDPKSENKVVNTSGPWKYYTGPDGTKRQDISGVEWVVLEGGKGKSLTQDMVSQKLRRYVIRGSFDLGGKTIKMPYGSVLDLESGSLSNGALVFDDTRVTPVYAISKQTKLNKVKVSGTYYETLVDLWGATEEPLFPWDTTAPKRVYMVDLKKFGITPGYQKKGSNGHYSDKQYDLMYNNGVGFTNAIQWAYKNGYDGIRFPKNDYCFTPRTTRNDKPTEAPMVLVQDLDKYDIDLGGGSYYLILSSKKKSKYYTLSPEQPYAQGGTLFFIAACINLQIHNGKMIGDRALRDYDVGFEGSLENSVAFAVSGYCQNIRLHHLEMSDFMADGIICSQSGGIWRGYDDGFQGIWRSYPGLSKPIDRDNDYSARSQYFRLNNLYTNADAMAFAVVRKIASKRVFSINNNQGYTRLINPYHNLKIQTFNEKKSTQIPLRTINTSYLETITLTPNETGVKIVSLYNDGFPVEGYEHSVTISELISSHVVIENSAFKNNHRGGISGGSNDVTIRNCCFNKQHQISNYLGKTIPLFTVGGTNYHINFEDDYAKDLTVYNCSFSRTTSSIGKLLFGVYTLDFHDNVSDTPVSVYNSLFCNVNDNVFSSGPLFFNPWRLSDYFLTMPLGFKYLTRVALVHNNKVGEKYASQKDNRTIAFLYSNDLLTH